MPAEALSQALPLPVLGDRLPVPVPKALDPVLDAAAECLSRHGPSRTSLSDIAREMGVAPSTVYRKVGSVDNATLLYMAREAQRFLDRIPELVRSAEGPRSITRVLAAGIRTAAADPVAAKILRDEGDWMARTVTRRLDGFLAQGADIAGPFLTAAMDAGLVRRQDPAMLAHWLLRVALVTLVTPPPGDLVEALDGLLLPALQPGRPGAKR